MKPSLFSQQSSFTNIKTKKTLRNYVPNQGTTEASFQIVLVLATAGQLSQTGK